MTLPDERYRAVAQTIKFLNDLAYPGTGYKRVPLAVRQEAHRLMRHYPSEWDMKRVAESSPHIFQECIEPLTRMIMVYDNEQKEENYGSPI